MKKIITALLLFATPFLLWSQNLPFNQVYQNHVLLPAGILETVSWTQTRFHNIDDSQPRGCMDMPLPYGVMGVFDEGDGYFKESGKYIAQLSGISVNQQKASVLMQIEAYASAFEQIYSGYSNFSESKRVYKTLTELSQIPDSGRVNLYARDAQVYEIMKFLNTTHFANEHNFPVHNYNLSTVFGTNNLDVLSAQKINFTSTGIEAETGAAYVSEMENSNGSRSTDYGPAIWNPAASCNYSSRGGASISAVTIHTVQGSYAGCISWFKNCNAQVSAHYVIRSSDGQITQMVRESNKAWHVGNSNPYTIGIEHEGYVTNASYYTIAMYNSSAALVRDICSSHGISRKREAYFPWSGTTYYNQSSIPGACVKIKGHQHFPNQTHNDPGPNWDWDYYYKKINNNTSPTTYTAASGTLYDSGGASGNYGNDEHKIWVVKPTGANSVTLNFTSFETENTWDYLYIYDGDDIFAPRIGIYTGNNSPGTVTSTGGAITVEFRSECATTKSGWNANWTADIPFSDQTPPTTDVSFSTDWKTVDFEAHFTDADESGGSGLDKSFYQVLYFDGTYWSANPSRGFFGDNFEGTSINSNWTEETGTWGISPNTHLEQSDDTEGNANIYAPLTQNLSNRYLYAWNGKISGTDANKRAGIHIFCDDATQSNRGNSYLVYFRAGGNPDPNNNNKVQIYKVNNNTLSLKKNISHTINPDQWYNFKVIFDRITGKLWVIVDGDVVTTWTDSSPFNDGNSVSFRSGNCNYEVDNFKVYRSRHPDVTITVGPGSNTDIPFQNSDPNTPAGKVKSIVMDNAGNLSNIAFQYVDVDWTKPNNLVVNDGSGVDIDTVYTNTLEGNWGTANDPHSGIVEYKTAIGTTAGADDVVGWTSNGTSSTLSSTVSGLVYDQIYYLSVTAKNGAGLIDTASSNGQRYVDLLSIKESSLTRIEMFPNPTVKELQFKNLEHPTEILIYDGIGQLVIQTKVDVQKDKIDVDELAAGTYNVTIKVGNQFIVKKLVKE